MPYLRRGFLAGTGRKAIDAPMVRLHMLRNRVAHHEPLLTVDLGARYIDVVNLAGRVSPELAAYVAAHTSWPTVVSERP